MKHFLFIISFIISASALAQSGASYSYLKLLPSTLTSICSVGTLRTNTSNNILEQCNSANNWYAIGSVEPTTAISTNYQIVNGDYFLDVNTGSARSINLPTPYDGRIVVVKDVTGGAATNNITVLPFAAETIDGTSSALIKSVYGSGAFFSDGTNWFSFGGGGGSSSTFADSIVNTSGTVTLINDSASPGNSMYYGTNSSGTLGYNALGTGSALAYYQGYFAHDNSWNLTSTSFGDFTSIGTTPALTSRTSSGITVTAASGGLPGITFTPPNTSATYQVIVQFAGYNGSTNGFWEMTDGGGNVLAGNPGLNSIDLPMTISAIYNPNTTSPVTMKIQGATSNGADPTYIITTTNTDARAIPLEWTVIQIPNNIFGGTLSLGTIGSSPNNNGAALSGGVLTLEPASSSFGGIVTTGSQTFGVGSKTFQGAVAVGNNLTVTGTTLLGQSAGNATTIGFASSTAVHQIIGGLKLTNNNQSSSYTLDNSLTDFFVSSNDSAGSPTYTLPTVSAGRLVVIKDSGGQAGIKNITVSPASGLIDGLSSLVMAGPFQTAMLYSDGTNWFNLNQGESVSARYHGYTSGGIGVSGNFTDIFYTTKDWDTGNPSYASGIYTCPSSGHYRLTAGIYPTAATITAATKYTIEVFVNGSNYADQDAWFATAATKPLSPQITTIFSCPAGQTVTVQGAYGSAETTPSITTSNFYNFIEIWKEGR